MRNIGFSEAIDCLKARENNFYDIQFPRSEIWMNPEGTMRLGEALPSVPLQEQALLTLANRIGIQAGYLKKCSGELIDLRAENVNRWLHQLPNDKEFFVRMDGNECRAILSTSYVPVRNLDLLERFYGLYHYSDEFMRVNLDLDSVSMSAQIYWISDEYTVELKPGDISHLGIHIGNSEVGFRSVEFSAYIFRLICTNGMVTGEKTLSFRRPHFTSVDRLEDMIDEAVPEIINSLPRTGELFRRSMDIEVADPDKELDILCNRHKLTGDQKEIVITVFQRNRQFTLFGLINAFTGAANQDGISLESRRMLQMAGGALLVEAGRNQKRGA